jgi:hypothetical protein
MIQSKFPLLRSKSVSPLVKLPLVTTTAGK